MGAIRTGAKVRHPGSGTVIGALVGYAIKTDHWVRVRWDSDKRD